MLGLGNVATEQRNYDGAQDRYNEVIELRKALVAADPKNESYQRDLATAQNNELQAVLAYRRSLVELERLQQEAVQQREEELARISGEAGEKPSRPVHSD